MRREGGTERERGERERERLGFKRPCSISSYVLIVS
jgi:hypothetical protein